MPELKTRDRARRGRTILRRATGLVAVLVAALAGLNKLGADRECDPVEKVTARDVGHGGPSLGRRAVSGD